MGLLVGILPVVLFLVFLFLLDSYKLVLKRFLFYSLLIGAICGGLSYLFNVFLVENLSIEPEKVSMFISPFTEELLKSVFIIWLISKKRIGFVIDAAIYGFAIGAGLSLIENAVYFYSLPEYDMKLWLMRGLGTGFMQGGCTALFATILIGSKSSKVPFSVFLLVSFLITYVIHSVFNHLFINPFIQTIGIITILPAIFMIIFKYNEMKLQDWLDIEMSSEVEMLNMIKKGQFLSTPSGEYLETLKKRFSEDAILDIYCYFQLYLELSIIAKRNIMLKECGLPIVKELDLENKLTELAQLRKQIGKTGEYTLSPLIRMSYRDLWEINSLKES